MKAKIHPKSSICVVSCTCGNKFDIISDKKEFQVEICSSCHPFYTGQQKLIDSAGRVDRFAQRYDMNVGKLAKLASSKDTRRKGKERLALKINPKKRKITPPREEKRAKPGAAGGK